MKIFTAQDNGWRCLGYGEEATADPSGKGRGVQKANPDYHYEESVKDKPGEKMPRLAILLTLAALFVAGCGVSRSDYDAVKAENESLRAELDECRFGADRLVALVEKAYKDNDYSTARTNIELLSSRHPESPKNAEFVKLLEIIEKRETEEHERTAAKEAAERKRRDAEEKERIRLENLNNTGMWTVGYYVDDFGEPTKTPYIRNTYLIRGTFSNTATEGSDLDVKFLISSASDISIMLYEYAGNNPVKGYSDEYYLVLVQDKDGKRMQLGARNYSDRLSLNEADSRKLHQASLPAHAQE